MFFCGFFAPDLLSFGIHEEVSPVPKPITDCASFAPLQAGKLEMVDGQVRMTSNSHINLVCELYRNFAVTVL